MTGSYAAPGAGLLVLATCAALGGALRAQGAAPRGGGIVDPVRSWRATSTYERALPGVLEEAARSLRGGASLRGALLEAGRAAPGSCAPRLAPLLDGAALGDPLADAVAAWAALAPDAGTRLAAAAFGLAAHAGGAPARSLDAVAATLRERLAAAGDVRALSAQARLSAVVIGLAPLVFAVFAAGVDRRNAAFLLATPLGRVCLAAGLLLDVVGLLWMRHIVHGVAP
ncbi:MAG: type II secretion system F family protein [Acidimicrobiales bacterium]